MEMRGEGLDYTTIGDTLGVSAGVARRLVQEGLQATVGEPAEEVRALEAFRLERLYKVCYGYAIRGDGAAIDRCLKIMERKAKLLGLDQPAEVDMAELRSHLFAQLRERLPAEVWHEVVRALADG
jgi:hypothetical protein